MKLFSIPLLLLFFFISCENPTKKQNINLTELTISEIHQAYKAGTYNSQQIVQTYIDAIKQVNDTINAISIINPQALTIAKNLDQEFQETKKLRPLHGIPIIVKDNINTAGLPTTAGSLALKDYIPEKDAFIIQKLVAAGAIILAKSNMAEWAFSPMHSESSTIGTTSNPYNTDFVPAGSSGGTAAAVAANLGTVGLGTDTGNSIRGPSSHCSLVGFRTTLGLVSRSAIVPLYLRNDVVGPMCRSVEDATKVLQSMTGYDPEDPVTKNNKGKIPENYTQFLNENGLKGARIGVLRELTQDIHPEIKTLFDNSLSDMEKLGAIVLDPIVVPHFAELRQNQWCASFTGDVETFLANYVKDDSLRTIQDIIAIGSKSDFAQNRLERNAENTGRWENPEITCADPYTDELRIAFREAIENVMDSLQLDAIVYPSWNYPPAHLDKFQEEYKGDNSQIISPHTGQPAFTVPMGYSANNLPAGLQFLGRMYSEPTLIKLTYAFEQGTKHRKPPKW